MNYNTVEIARQQRQDHLREAQREQLTRYLVPQPSVSRVAMLNVVALLVSVDRCLQAPALSGGRSLNSGMAG